MNQTQRSAILIFCCAAAIVLFLGSSRGWWPRNGFVDVGLPLGLIVGGLAVWASGRSSRGG